MAGHSDELDVEDKVGHRKDECLVSRTSHWLEEALLVMKKNEGIHLIKKKKSKIVTLDVFNLTCLK